VTEDLLSLDSILLALRRAGYGDLADASAKALPDPLALDEVARFLAEHGVTHAVLTDRMGGSP
jgi:hypothetical protein